MTSRFTPEKNTLSKISKLSREEQEKNCDKLFKSKRKNPDQSVEYINPLTNRVLKSSGVTFKTLKKNTI